MSTAMAEPAPASTQSRALEKIGNDVVTEPELRKYPSHHHGAAIIQYGNFESFVKDIRLMMDYNLSKFLNKINFTGVLQIKRSCFLSTKSIIWT